MAFYAPDPIQSTQFIPGGNVPAAGGLLFCYLVGSSTKQNTYTDASASTARTNPIVLDSGGNIPGNGEVWIASTAKFVLAPSNDSDPPASPYWTRDNLPGVNDPSNVQTEWIPIGLTPTFINASTFAVGTDQTLTLTVNRRLKTVNTAGTLFSTISSSAFGTSTTVGIISDGVGLDAGLTSVSYGLIPPTSNSLPHGAYTVLKLIPTGTSQSFRNQADTVDNVLITDAGNVTVRGSETIGGLVDLSSSTAGQIKFSSTSASTTDPLILDIYQELSFTPEIAFGASTTGITYGSQAGRATKIGNLCFVHGDVNLSSTGSVAGRATLVFTGLNGVGSGVGIPLTVARMTNFNPSVSTAVFLYLETVTSASFQRFQNGVMTDMNNADFMNNSVFSFAGFIKI